MTLFRKGLVRWYTHAFWYTLALYFSLGAIYAVTDGYWFWVKIVAVFAVRVNLGVDKYILWATYSMISLPCVETVFFEKYGAFSDSVWANPTLASAKFGNGQRQLGLAICLTVALLFNLCIGTKSPRG